jgi:signal peptidase I
MSAASAVSHVHFEPSVEVPRGNHPLHTISENILKHGSACVSILDGSMFPWFRSGDLVFIRRCDFERVRVGDVVLFEHDGELLLHRVIRRIRNAGAAAADAGTLLVTKGDARDGEDAPVSAREFLGRAIRIHRRRRHIDLESLERQFVSRIIARIADAMPLAYRPFRAIKNLLFARHAGNHLHRT